MYIVEEGSSALVTCSAALDLAGWQQLLLEVARLDCPAVVDTRNCQVTLTELDAYLLALRASRLPTLARHRTAFVTAGNRDRHMAFFARCSQHRGLRMRAFDDPAAASNWALQSALLGAA